MFQYARKMLTKETRPQLLDSIMVENKSSRIYVPATLARDTLLHLIQNYHTITRGYAPLIFTLTGRFGTGKSCTLREIFRRLKVYVEVLSASTFENQYAGVPASMIAEAYLRAGKIQTEEKRPAVMLLDELDLAVGSFKNVTSSTTNTQHCISAIMEIADHPTQVRGRGTDRVPFFTTMNDVSKVYGALTRSGRMRVVKWDPQGRELILIVSRIFSGMLTYGQIIRLTAEHKTWSLADYSQLRSILELERIEDLFANMPAHAAVMSALESQHKMNLSETLSASIEAAELRRAVERMAQEQDAKVDFTSHQGEPS